MSYDIISLIPDYLDVITGRATIEGGLPLHEGLDHGKFDFSLDSLRALDLYLDRLHLRAAVIDDTQYTNIVLAAGIYLGEVIRRLSSAQFAWINYGDYFATRPELTDMVPETLGTLALLASPPDRMTLPLNKIIRYIEEGPENNTHYYASCEL